MTAEVSSAALQWDPTLAFHQQGTLPALPSLPSLPSSLHSSNCLIFSLESMFACPGVYQLSPQLYMPLPPPLLLPSSGSIAQRYPFSSCLLLCPLSALLPILPHAFLSPLPSFLTVQIPVVFLKTPALIVKSLLDGISFWASLFQNGFQSARQWVIWGGGWVLWSSQ